MPVSIENRKLFVMAMCKDAAGEGPIEARAKYLEEHLEYVETILDKVLVAGPIFADDRQTVVGSMLIYKTDDKSEAEEILSADPYYSAGIWESVEFQVFRGALGDAVGGKSY